MVTSLASTRVLFSINGTLPNHNMEATCGKILGSYVNHVNQACGFHHQFTVSFSSSSNFMAKILLTIGNWASISYHD